MESKIATMYYCNPDLNTACGKQSCYICGGDCVMTKHEEFSRTGDIPKEQADTALIMLEYFLRKDN